MKLTKETLKRIIKEELDMVLSEEELEEGWKQNLALGLGLMGAGAGVANYNTDAPTQGDQITQTDGGYLDGVKDRLSKRNFESEFYKIQQDYTAAKLALEKDFTDGAAAKKQTQAVQDLKDLRQRSGINFQLK